MQCSICKEEIEKQVDQSTGKVFWDQGHNAEPLVEDGRCCDTCNYTKVIPVRLGIVIKNK